MGGSVFFVALVVVIGGLLAIFASPIFLVPALLLVLAALFAGPLLAMVGYQGGGAKTGNGTPTTSEATYDPVAPPDQRQAV
jgi:hypothetical protein